MSPAAVRSMNLRPPSSDEMVDVPQGPLQTTKGRTGAKQRLRPEVVPVTPHRRRTRSTYKYDEINSSPPLQLEAAHFDEVDEQVDEQVDEVNHEPLESPVKPVSPVQVSGSYEYRECTPSPQGRPQSSPFSVVTQSMHRPYHALKSPFRFVPHQAEQDLEGSGSDWSSDYGSPQDAATHYMPATLNHSDNLEGSSPYRNTPKHWPLFMMENRRDIKFSQTPISELIAGVSKGWPSPDYVAAPDHNALSMVKNRQAVRLQRTPPSEYSSPYEDLPQPSSLRCVLHDGTRHQPEFEKSYAPRFSSKLKIKVHSSSPHLDEDLLGRDEWNEALVRGRTHSRSISKKERLIEESPSPCAMKPRSRKSRMTSYGISGGARVFSAALNGLNDGETGMLKDAIGKPLPSSPAEEGTVKVLSETPTREIATGFDAHHDSMLWSDEPEEHCSCQIQSKASRGSCHFAAKTVAPLMEEPIIKAPMGTRNLSGATIVPSVEGQPQLVNDEPIMLVRHGVPAWFSKEQEHCEKDSEAHVVRKYTVEAQVQPTSHSVLPCEGTESCASRVVRLEQQNERLTKEVEQLRQETNHLRMFAVGVSCLLIGGALVLARLRRS